MSRQENTEKDRGEESVDWGDMKKMRRESSPYEEEVSIGERTFPIAVLSGFGVLAIIIGIILLWNLYSGETTGGWFREISSILLINLGFIGWGFGVLISVVKDGFNKQNKLLDRLLSIEEKREAEGRGSSSTRD